MLGTVDLCGPDDLQMRTVLAQPKRLALLAYLTAAIPQGFHSRDTLLTLFWPELDQKHASASLRQSLYVLRRALSSDVVITCGDEVVGLDHTRIWCDVTAFSQATDAGRHSEALALYGGEFLAGSHMSDSLGFDEWLERQRARLAARAVTAAWALTECEARQGNLVAALEWARRVRVLDPDDERALRRVILLLDQLGNRIAALREYRTFAKRIATEYAMAPAQETEQLISAIRSPV